MLSRPEAGEPTGTKGRLGGFLPRRTQTRPGRAAAFRLEVPPERTRTLRRKERSALAVCPRSRAPRRIENAPPDLSGRDSAVPLRGRIWPTVRQRAAWTGRRLLTSGSGTAVLDAVRAHAFIAREGESGAERLRGGGWKNRPPCGRSRGLDTAIGVVRLHHSRRVRPVEERAARVRNGTRENRSHEQPTTS